MQDDVVPKVLVLCGLFLGCLAATAVGPAKAEEDLWNVVEDGVVVLDVRYRFEFVDQDAKAEDARANTLRTRVGYRSGTFHGVGLVFDFEWTEGLGAEDFNNTINGKTQFPVVADPDDAAVNQLYVVADNTIPYTKLKFGRQRVIWDNHRFIGSVGFRQNEQTFDAVRLSTSLLQDTEIEYIYLNRVHRIFGRGSPVGRLGMKSHGIRAQYTGLDFLTITPFALFLDYDQISESVGSSASFGMLLDGSYPLDDDWTLLYTGSFAYQEDYADNPADFELWYYSVAPGLSYGPLNVRLGYEFLQGNGMSAFQTPLATLHKFNGLTDQFLTTPPDGLEDFSVSAAAKVADDGWLSGLVVRGGYHEFFAENTDSHYGREWDIGVFKTFATSVGDVMVGVQFANYDADEFSTDTRKLWVTTHFKLAAFPLGELANVSSEN